MKIFFFNKLYTNYAKGICNRLCVKKIKKNKQILQNWFDLDFLKRLNSS